MLHHSDTVVALATAQGVGAIAVIRLSGADAFTICEAIFSKKISDKASHTIHFGTIKKEDGNILDEVLVSIFKAPSSYTKENVVEISTHGSPYVVQSVIQLLIQKGARLAKPGEFTQRAFLNGQLDLAQAEAVADLISSDSEAAHHAAMNQMRGGFSAEIKQLREELIYFASMIELELDFSEEDVEFADRSQLIQLITRILKVVNSLSDSFRYGNVIKEGIPVVIVGKPNAGKSTLLNRLFNEEKAIVSEIPGTTRDFIEDELIIDGIKFRFVDTAGIRMTTDSVEAIGVARTYEKMDKASLIIYLFDVKNTTYEDIIEQQKVLSKHSAPLLFVGNKIDTIDTQPVSVSGIPILYISAKGNIGVDELKKHLLMSINKHSFKTGDTVVTNLRHYQSLVRTGEALHQVLKGIEQKIPGDLLAMDIRQSLFYLGEITGEITHEDLLDTIFSKFCIGK